MARGGKNKLPGTPGGYGSQAVQVARSSQYGEAAAAQRAQEAVPLPKMGPDPTAMPAPSFAPGQVPLNAPTGRPSEPISEGASFGLGGNLQDLSLPAPPTPEAQVDPTLFTAYLPQLEAVASQPNSSPSLRAFVRRLRSNMPADFDLAGDQ